MWFGATESGVRIPPHRPSSVSSAARITLCRGGGHGFESHTERHNPWSSNDRTGDFESQNLGLNPSRGTNEQPYEDMKINTLGELDAALKPILPREFREEELNEDERHVLRLEQQACAISFIRFLNYCKITEPPVPGKQGSGGVITLEKWPHILEMAQAFLNHRFVVNLKSRQIGASWLCAAYDLWFAKYHEAANVFLYSKGETEAWEKLDKCRRIENHLPKFLRQIIKPDNNDKMHFPGMLSTIRAFPSTQSAGISFTASILDLDEWEEHPYAESNYAMAKPVIDAGGQLIGTFTVNKMKPDTLAKTIFQEAWYHPEDSEFKALFFPYWVRPGRDEHWYQKKQDEIPDEELQGLSKQLYMEQNYPRSVEEALRPTQTTAAFDLDVIESMLQRTREPIPIKNYEIDTSVVNIYQDFDMGEYYIAGTDTGHGVGKDYSVTTVMNVRTGEVVADIIDNTISPDELARQSYKLLEHFRFPLWYIEVQDRGSVTLQVASDLGYPNLGVQDDYATGKKTQKLGFSTEGHRTATGVKGTRTDLWGALIPAMNNRRILIYSRKGLLQFRDIVRNVEKEGRIEAKSGRNDDYPMAVGTCWYKRGEVDLGVNNESQGSISALTINSGVPESMSEYLARRAEYESEQANYGEYLTAI